MRENLIQTGKTGDGGRRYIEYDWYGGGIPPNVVLGENVYLDTSYGFALFNSEREVGLELGAASGTYDRASFIVGEEGRVKVGSYTVLNGSIVVCNKSVEIGNHCLIAWGAVITDTWSDFAVSTVARRREILRSAAADSKRRLRPVAEARPVVIEDNVWVGFDSVVLPGVRLGRGAVVGCRSVISEDVPPYAITVGNPARHIRFLEPDDTPESIEKAFAEYLKK